MTKGTTTKGTTTKYKHNSQDLLAASISDCLRSMKSGTITIHLDKKPFLKLTIAQSDTDKFRVEFGQKFMEMSLVIGLNKLFDTN